MEVLPADLRPLLERVRIPRALLHRLLKVLSRPGTLDSELRRAAAARRDLPAPLAEFADKVTRHSHRVTDADLAKLRAAGYSEDQIFELTISVAVGTGIARLEAGLRAMKGGE